MTQDSVECKMCGQDEQVDAARMCRQCHEVAVRKLHQFANCDFTWMWHPQNTDEGGEHDLHTVRELMRTVHQLSGPACRCDFHDSRGRLRSKAASTLMLLMDNLLWNAAAKKSLPHTIILPIGNEYGLCFLNTDQLERIGYWGLGPMLSLLKRTHDNGGFVTDSTMSPDEVSDVVEQSLLDVLSTINDEKGKST